MKLNDSPYFIMKKLTKLSLHGAQLMNDAEMKRILGGDDPALPSYGSGCEGKKINDPCIDEETGWVGTCQYAGTGVVGCV